jgi:hypothetical protein
MEISRKFRVLAQTLSMHTALRDRYANLALAVDVLLLACSVVFCATAFASDEVLSHFGPAPEHIRFLLRAFSVLAFMLSVLSLRVDWKGKSVRHREASEKLSRALSVFRKNQEADGSWSPEALSELDSVYSEAMHNSVPVPEASFVRLKARHLRKVQLSKMLDSNPGCPVLVLRLSLFFSSIGRALRSRRSEDA